MKAVPFRKEDRTVLVDMGISDAAIKHMELYCVGRLVWFINAKMRPSGGEAKQQIDLCLKAAKKIRACLLPREYNAVRVLAWQYRDWPHDRWLDEGGVDYDRRLDEDWFDEELERLDLLIGALERALGEPGEWVWNKSTPRTRLGWVIPWVLDSLGEIAATFNIPIITSQDGKLTRMLDCCLRTAEIEKDDPSHYIRKHLDRIKAHLNARGIKFLESPIARPRARRKSGRKSLQKK